MASNKNIMTAVLLTPGPISTRLTVKNMSPAFRLGVSKSKFMNAANQLQSAGLGSLVLLDKISAQAHMFVKKPPHEMRVLLESDEHTQLNCTEEEYAHRYHSSLPASVTYRMKESLVEMGILSQQAFMQDVAQGQQRSLSDIPTEEAEPLDDTFL